MARRYATSRYVRELASELSDRDYGVLERVCALRFVSGDQLTRLCFAISDDQARNARAARRALVRLTRLGFLERLPRRVGGVRAGSAGFVYRLGLGGYRLSVMRGWQPGGDRRRSQVPGTLFVTHALQVAELHIRLTESDRAGHIELLALECEPSCWRSLDGLADQRLRPDSYVRFGLGQYEDSYFIEVDNATRGTRAIDAQLERYVAYYRTGHEQAAHGVFPRVLWLTPNQARAAAIAARVRELPTETHAVFRTAVSDDALSAMHIEMDGDSNEH